jgi:hypothetical protein
MKETEIHVYARHLKEMHGFKALAEATQRAGQLEQQGDADQAQDWRRIAAVLREMRGPHAS